MEDELEATNPVEGAEASEAEVEEQEVTEPLFDDDGNPIEDQAEDEDEVDLDDETKLKLPKSQAEKLRQAMLRQADYTKKTQELAEARKSFEAERQSIAQADAEEMQAIGIVRALDSQLSQYTNVNWVAWRQQARAADQQNFDTAEMDKYEDAKAHYDQLKEGRDQASQFLGTKQQERQSKQQQAKAEHAEAIAKLYDQGTPELKKAIPDWSPAKAAKLIEETAKNFGYSVDEIRARADGESDFLFMHAAALGMQAMAKSKQAQNLQKQQEVKPAAKVGGAAPKQGLDDRLSAEEWMKRRNEQLRKRG